MKYDLEDRTLKFARDTRAYARKLPRTVLNTSDPQQLIRSGSVGANTIEANESSSKNNFRMRIKIAKKEAQETRYWRRLIDEPAAAPLIGEAKELMLINVRGQLWILDSNGVLAGGFS